VGGNTQRAFCSFTVEVNMDSRKRTRLESAGWTASDSADFLELTPAERELVESRVASERAARGSRKKFDHVLKKVRERRQPPVEGDEV
jgi:hypothetical protein